MIYQTFNELEENMINSDSEFIAIFTNKKLLYDLVDRNNIHIVRDVIKDKSYSSTTNIYKNYYCIVCRFNEYYIGQLIKNFEYEAEDDLTIMVME